MIAATRFRPASQLWVFVVFAGLVGYCNFPPPWVIGSPLSPTPSYFSELSVAGQPAYQAFRIGDVMAGSGLAVLAGIVLIRRPSPLTRVGSAALAVAATTSIVDAVSPMSCAPSIGVRCWDADHAPLPIQLTQLHTMSGVIGFTAIVMALAAYGIALPRQPDTHHLGSAGLAVAAAGAALGCIEIATALTGSDWTGLFERIHVFIVSVYLATLTISVARSVSPRGTDRRSSEVTFAPFGSTRPTPRLTS